MRRRLVDLAERWCDLAGIEPARRPDPARLDGGFGSDQLALRPPIEAGAIRYWEARHGYDLPDGLRAWLTLSDGLFGRGPLVHPLSAIGPMVPFAKVPGLVVQPESWFELGNPNLETVCLDLAYRWPEGGSPIFTSGDDDRGSRPRLIAASFEAWFLGVLDGGGREYWFDPGYPDLGDPWAEHRRRVPPPRLPPRLAGLSSRVSPLIVAGHDERSIAARFGITPLDVEAIARHIQHGPSPVAVAAGLD